MPAGVSWGTYLRFGAVAMLSMFAGAQVVHIMYKPLQDMDEYIEREKEIMVKEAEEKKER